VVTLYATELTFMFLKGLK